jgi:hypothetical protein
MSFSRHPSDLLVGGGETTAAWRDGFGVLVEEDGHSRWPQANVWESIGPVPPEEVSLPAASTGSATLGWPTIQGVTTPVMTPDGPGFLGRRWRVDLQGLRWAGAAMMGLGLVLPHLPHNPGLPCPLRTLTGVPCPACGLSTSVKALCGGHVHDAIVANPFGLVAVFVAVLLIVRPRWRETSVPLWPLALAAVVSWVWQLHRFGWL